MPLISTRRVDIHGRPIGALIRHRNTRAVVAYLMAALAFAVWCVWMRGG